jgi:hypothetical protein
MLQNGPKRKEFGEMQRTATEQYPVQSKIPVNTMQNQGSVLRKFLFFIVVIFSAACGNDRSASQTSKNDSTGVYNPADMIPDKRDSVKKEPVAEYRVKTDNPLNDWYFSVSLFETQKTFHYLIRLQYEEIKGTDTLRLPNFGTMPKPEIRKGEEKFSCIIGFRDKDDKFREYKKVFVDDNRLRIVALKHYAVYTTQQQDSAK